jgi:hypothetical protein
VYIEEVITSELDTYTVLSVFAVSEHSLTTELCPTFAPGGINRSETMAKQKVLPHIIR